MEEKALEEKRERVVKSEKKVKQLERVKLERERKRNAAFARKVETAGGKPTGITKPVVTPR